MTATIYTSPASTDTANEVIADLRRQANARKMLEEPFFVTIRDRELSRDELGEFFQQYYTIVKTSYRMLAAGILSTPPEDVAAIKHLVRFLDTESGGDPSHLTYYMRWAEHFGVSEQTLTNTEPNAKSQAFETTLMDFFTSGDSFVQRAAQLGVEDCAEVLIEGLDQGFARYPMPGRAYAYLRAHLLLENDEDGHSRWAIDSLVEDPELPDRLDEIETIYHQVYQAFAGVFHGIYETWHRPWHRS